MDAAANRVVNGSAVLGTSADEVSWHTTQASLTQEEEDAIVSLVVVVVGVIVAIAVLFSMGILIDCRHQKKEGSTKRKLRLKMPPVGRRGRNFGDDGKSLASDMCPNGDSESGIARTDMRDAVV